MIVKLDIFKILLYIIHIDRIAHINRNEVCYKKFFFKFA